MEWYTGLDVADWTVIRKTFGNQRDHLGERFKEHLKALSSTCEHQSSISCITWIKDFSIVGRERHSIARTIKASIYIQVWNATFSRTLLSIPFHIFGTEILFTTPELNQKQQESQVHNTTPVTSILWGIVEENISCWLTTPRSIVEKSISVDLMKPSCQKGKIVSPKVSYSDILEPGRTYL